MHPRGVTHERCILKYGEEKGQQKWDEYRQKQSITNTFEYKRDKFGMSKDDFELFNKKRSSTLENFKLRYGNEDGQKRWDDYKSRQHYTKSRRYYIDLFGDLEGSKKYDEVNAKKINSKKSFLLKYGNEEGEFRYNEYVKNGFITYSKSSQECFDTFLLLLTPEEKTTTFYATFNYEKNVDRYKVDFLVEKLNLVVEYLGDYWHCNPMFMNENEKNRSGKTAKEIRESDRIRKDRLEKLGYYVVYIWENDWKTNRNQMISHFEKVLYDRRNEICKNI